MRVFVSGRVSAGIGIVLGSVILVLLAVPWAREAPASSKGEAVSIPQSSCFWKGPITTRFSDEGNAAFPDTGAVYWTTTMRMPEGSRIVLHGRFAHARYQSLNSYRSSDRSPTDALNDISTVPDKGSYNPFKVGARRDTPGRIRKYTVRILDQLPPEGPGAKNTLYAGVEDQSVQQLIYRVYVPDSFTRKDLTGGVGLPSVELILADGTIMKGQSACDEVSANVEPLTIQKMPQALYETYRHPGGEEPWFPSTNPTTWRAFYNVTFSLQCGYGGECDSRPERTGGQYSNIDNAYVSAAGNKGFPRGPVWVLHGRMPITVRTGPQVKRMPGGQLRYWSLCQNESMVTTAGAGCLYDSQVPRGRNRWYTIVSSLPGDRPRNARRKCGVGWIPWPANGDGVGSLDDGFLILRNMLPASGFRHAVQNTTVPGDEKQVMGEYLPTGRYTTKSKFEKKRGCPKA